MSLRVKLVDTVEVPTEGVIPVTCPECGEGFEAGDKGMVRPHCWGQDLQSFAWMVLVHEECE